MRPLWRKSGSDCSFDCVFCPLESEFLLTGSGRSCETLLVMCLQTRKWMFLSACAHLLNSRIRLQTLTEGIWRDLFLNRSYLRRIWFPSRQISTLSIMKRWKHLICDCLLAKKKPLRTHTMNLKGDKMIIKTRHDIIFFYLDFYHMFCCFTVNNWTFLTFWRFWKAFI